MLHYTEVTSSSTFVPVMPHSSEQCQHLTSEDLSSLLSVLFAHPEFQRGLAQGHEAFPEEYEPAPLTEDEMMEEVEMNLSPWVIERGKALDRASGKTPTSYLCNLGFVIGIITQGLTYTQAQQGTEAASYEQAR